MSEKRSTGRLRTEIGKGAVTCGFTARQYGANQQGWPYPSGRDRGGGCRAPGIGCRAVPAAPAVRPPGSRSRLHATSCRSARSARSGRDPSGGRILVRRCVAMNQPIRKGSCLKDDHQRHRHHHRRRRGGRPPAFDRRIYHRRNLIERCCNPLKGCIGIATRYDKTATSDEAAVGLASFLLWARSVGRRPQVRLVRLISPPHAPHLPQPQAQRQRSSTSCMQHGGNPVHWCSGRICGARRARWCR